MTLPSTGSPLSAASSMRFHLDLVGRVHGAADRELGYRNDAFRLVADVDEDLVLVDPDHLASHDLPLVDDGEGRVVIGDQLTVGTLSPDPFVRLRI
jgi:hypothetical protein